MSGMASLPTPDFLKLLATVLMVMYLYAQAAERAIVIAKPLLDKIQDAVVLASVKVATSFAIGALLAWASGYNLFEQLLVPGMPVFTAYLSAGVITSGGSSAIHAILEWLKGLPTPTVSTTVINKTDTATGTETTVTGSTKNVVVSPKV